MCIALRSLFLFATVPWSLLQCPHQLSPGKKWVFSHLSRVFSHSPREKSFFFPPYDSCRSSLYTKLGEASRREEKNCHHNYFHPRPPCPDRTPARRASPERHRDPCGRRRCCGLFSGNRDGPA